MEDKTRILLLFGLLLVAAMGFLYFVVSGGLLWLLNVFLICLGGG